MKSSYTARTGHERYRKVHKNSNSQATKRRKTALFALKAQLKTGTKTNKKGEEIPLLPEDIERIKKEIEILEIRI